MNAILDYHYASFYGPLLEPFKNEAFGPKLATALLAASALVLIVFLLCAAFQASRLVGALKAIRGNAGRSEDSETRRLQFLNNFDEIDAALLSNKTVSQSWREFRKTRIHSSDPAYTAVLVSSRPQQFFTVRNLKIQYDLVRSLPNIFVGIGLLGTFVGLIAALTFSTDALTKADDQAHIKAALNSLLTTAAAKFYISAAGLVASILLAVAIKLILKHLHRRQHELVDALDDRVVVLSDQALSEMQLAAQKDSLTELKLFNTNIAMKIGDAVRSAVEQTNGALTARLAEIADSFGQLVNSSREGTGKAVDEAIKGALDSSLKSAGEAINGIARDLRDVPDVLRATANSIKEAGQEAAKQQDDLANKIQDSVKTILAATSNQLSETLTTGTKGLTDNLANTGLVFGESANKISSFFEKFSASGEDYMKSLSSLADQNGAMEKSLTTIVSRITAASEGISKATASVDQHLQQVMTGIREFSVTAKESALSVKQSQEAVKNTVDTLQKQMQSHIARFDDVDKKLAGAFEIMGETLEIQAKKTSEHLTQMDGALAGAVNHFGELIGDLVDANSPKP